MITNDGDIERLIEARLLRVNAVSFGLVAGFVAGLGLFVATNWLVLKGGEHIGPHLGLLGQYFVGYRVSFAGSLIGFAWAFACGFGLGSCGAWLYNRVAELRHGKTPAEE